MGDDRPEVPGLRFLGPLGRGGMGEVMLAEEVTTGRRVAVKWFSATGGADDGEGEVDGNERERFRREARTLARLDHPHLVKVHRLDEACGRPFMVMELIEGGSLADRIAERGPLPVAEALAIARQVVAGLAAAWRHGIVHRDVKPSNLLFDDESVVKVVDFGLASRSAGEARESRLTRTGFVVGSPHYMSPEQIRGEPLDLRSDLYSLGIVLFEMLAGRPPFDGRSQGAILAAHLSEEPPDPTELRPELPSEVAGLVRRLLAKDRSERPGSAAEVLEALEGRAAAFRPAPCGGAAGRRRSRIRAVPLAAVLASVTTVAILGWWGLQDGGLTHEGAAPAPAPAAPVAPERPGPTRGALGPLDLMPGADGREIVRALGRRAAGGLSPEPLAGGGVRAEVAAGLWILSLHVTRSGDILVLAAPTAGDIGTGRRPVRLPGPSPGTEEGWRVLVAAAEPLEPPAVLGARPHGRIVIYPAVLEGASGTVHPAHDLLLWLEARLGPRSAPWELAVLAPDAGRREAGS